MKRSALIACKEKALDRMNLCASIFLTNKPPSQAQCVEMQAHAMLILALNSELGPPLTADIKPTLDQVVIQRCAERLSEYVANEASPTRLVEDTLLDLHRLLKGGAK